MTAPRRAVPALDSSLVQSLPDFHFPTCLQAKAEDNLGEPEDVRLLLRMMSAKVRRLLRP